MSLSDSGSGYSEHPNTLRSLFDTGVLIGGRYRVVRFIARGGMGLVYEVEDEESGERLALKALKPEVARLTSSLERFQREIRLTQRIVHPNVCRVFEAGQHELPKGRSIRFFTMEMLPGQTLSEYLDEHGPLTTDEAEPIVRQLASGLGAAHRAGVAHRDFKPSNVLMVSKDGGLRAVITDFGLARSLVSDERSLSQTLTQSGQLMGTPAYFAPELLEGERVQGPGDFYALGVVVYEMLTGELPFTGRTPLVIALKRLREPAIPLRQHLPDVPVVWDRMVSICLQRYPKQRFAKAEELLALFDDESEYRPSTTQIVDTLLKDEALESERQGHFSLGRWALIVVMGFALVLIWPLLVAEPPEPVYVAILPPRVEAPAEQLEVINQKVVTLQMSLALQRIGHRIPGVRVVEAPLGDAWADSEESSVAERFAVDDVIASRITYRDGDWKVDLSRLSAGEEVWQRSSAVVGQPEQWSHALVDSLWQAYDSLPRRPGLGARFELNHQELEDLAEFSRARQEAISVGEWAALLDDLQAMRRRVPQFFEVHLATAEVSLELCRRLRQEECLAAARSALDAARLVAPGDLRVYSLDLQLALLAEDAEDIERKMQALADVSPGDVQLSLGEAAVAWQRGHQEEAVEILIHAVDRRPLWNVVASLARYEQGSGASERAAERLEELSHRAGDDPMLTARWKILLADLAEGGAAR